MAIDFAGLQTEVKRRALRNNAGTEFEQGTKIAINAALFTIANESLWRQLRRKTTFDTIAEYTTGTGAATYTNGSKNVTVVGATFLTDNIQPGRRIDLGDNTVYTIKTITGETTLTIDQNYGGDTVSGTGSYKIYAQEEYNLPIQTNHDTFLWHEQLSNPYRLWYLTDQDFYKMALNNHTESIPTHYRMWGDNSVIEQVKEASVVNIASSSTSDTSIAVTVFGTVAGYPDFEIITTNDSDGTTTSAGSKSFSEIERVVCSSSRVGRITATANSGNTTVSVIPVGDTATSISYAKVQLWPLPNSVFPMNVQYYKTPYALVNSGDVHELGDKFNEAIILLAVTRIKYEQGQTDDGDKMRDEYKREIRKLKKRNTDKIDWIPKLKRPSESGRIDPLVHSSLAYSQVGANFGPSIRR